MGSQEGHVGSGLNGRPCGGVLEFESSMERRAFLNSLIEKVAESPAPSRELFAEVWFATTGKQNPDIKGRFAVLMDAKAWTEAARITVACALPDWRVVTKATRGAGEALMLPPDHLGIVPEGSSGTVRHLGGAALAILQAMLEAKAASQ